MRVNSSVPCLTVFRGKRLSYANVAATLALIFSMSGGALAASHYLINSTKQINPSVLKTLKGKNGAKGAAGATGPQGPQGFPGQQGFPGVEGKEGKPGASAAAYAFMDRSEKDTLPDSHNFSPTYTEPETGVYCLTPAGNVTPSADPIAIVTPEFGFSKGSELSAYPVYGAPGCGTGDTQYEVVTYEPAGTHSNQVAFYIVIPAQ